ncbi:VOC family protein [Actinoplanes sp. GCM10030250]|uniref:VOC family protein n=1 Tax=Actinoplanes sp. GCM10030250 TaxID=3273376 RepID=UPI0036070533
MSTARLDHIGLNVADLAAAETWYCAAFGLRTELRLRVEGNLVEPVDRAGPSRIFAGYGRWTGCRRSTSIRGRRRSMSIRGRRRSMSIRGRRREV